jgi:hypothetical protein
VLIVFNPLNGFFDRHLKKDVGASPVNLDIAFHFLPAESGITGWQKVSFE